MQGTLYIVATPIGNLEDITLRAIRILSEVDIILAEDTRVTKKLLYSINDKWPMLNDKLISYHQQSDEKKKFEILHLLVQGKNIALVSDAGTPGISDPGNELIDFILGNDPHVKIVPIPGPSAITTALSVSGFNTNKFIFLGFWPKKKQNKLVSYLKDSKLPFIFYESPYRILKTFDLLEKEFGEGVEVLIARELTKIHETLYRGGVNEVRNSLEHSTIKGELVVVVSF
ncbi:16S rRNA (cytidine(1402)-2'-O)-methyltransferase [Candidatus Woesebacteria bacterium RIFCSPLOWO2_01_FULL_39_23]|uniref:Ribosomal RNA small subunit methyltransferase I n=1 Tax=Candidatus Woesebacteria bacterium RIFCSPHIGHO2_01_FULL_40_22 TaxID=1802499 RepID=A0A1F7YM86_9BACT|nr:MAG: 16S rRNA (cytidine(1402)-2'-O)-methyltransferase [Candidatus Woesebacteria bacterium RBG_16_40_11]OGM27655.1 MAG: 16S rRNA (cytidine(1402)-2'-O)-methyltransferase [Candidatus Woesebacteria bacterium RIFCSPHIGHO2_01_FULL_40_22]OGM63483.1 MAG: 16S rRNA (cytidine(1402)-2'-O)-methyltransferase [Candidatus Woesebacteria bacterium RIFCSPLOWO2_01_FULL_39_23]